MGKENAKTLQVQNSRGEKMKTKKEIKAWLLENCVDCAGNIDLSELDFSNFDGNVFIRKMKVKNNLWQDRQETGGDLHQSDQRAEGIIYQENQKAKDGIQQDNYRRSVAEVIKKVKSEILEGIIDYVIWSYNKKENERIKKNKKNERKEI